MRELQHDIRITEIRLAELNTSIKAHPSRPAPGAKPSNAWLETCRTFDHDRATLTRRLARLVKEYGDAKLELNARPLSTVSLGDLIDKLIEVEAEFDARGTDDAWDKLSAFIDWLEREHERINTLETAAAGTQERKAS